MNIESSLCIYNRENFISAWVIWSKFKKKFKYILISKKNEIDYSYFNDKEVFLLGTSLYFELEQIKSLAKYVYIIDNEINNFDIPGIYNTKISTPLSTWNNMYKSDPPLFLEYVNEKFLNRYDRLPNTFEVNLALKSYPLEFDEFDKVRDSYIDDLVIEGKTLLRIIKKEIFLSAFIINYKDKKISAINSNCLLYDYYAYETARINEIGCGFYIHKNKIYISLFTYKKDINLMELFNCRSGLPNHLRLTQNIGNQNAIQQIFEKF